jgi:hypothetical protein
MSLKPNTTSEQHSKNNFNGRSTVRAVQRIIDPEGIVRVRRMVAYCADSGTETVKQVAIQYALHDEIVSNDPRKDQHRYVKSTRNKIKACWSRHLKDIVHAIMEVLLY